MGTLQGRLRRGTQEGRPDRRLGRHHRQQHQVLLRQSAEALPVGRGPTDGDGRRQEPAQPDRARSDYRTAQPQGRRRRSGPPPG
ncbi:hypothetical protein ADK92_11205 [Streptomyces sp. XY533]|nr:hypothetical protein ADK92_11205 [Streptomyces sp. XY533]